MRITNYLKNYPFTIISLFFLILCVSVLVIENRVFADKEKSNPNCTCKTVCLPKTPNTYPEVNYPCEKGYFDASQDIYCICKNLAYEYNAMGGLWQECRKKKPLSCNDCSVTNACEPACQNKCKIFIYYSHCVWKQLPGNNGIECNGCYYDYIGYDEYGFPVSYNTRKCSFGDCA
ncbi:MAG: hypothetical protein N2169_07710 [bacterium]|nr:hypothetical protein [bacterium]